MSERIGIVTKKQALADQFSGPQDIKISPKPLVL
jgi:hypothetical protein